MDRLRSQIADLSGVRRGHVSIVCGQAVLPYFMVEQIANYRKEHPGVTFSVKVCNRHEAVDFLTRYDADLAVVFEPKRSPDFQSISLGVQQLHAIFSPNHSLAQKATIGWSDLLSTPLMLPTQANGVRHMFEESKGGDVLPIIESDSFDFIRKYLLTEECVSLQIPIGLPRSDEQTERRTDQRFGLVSRPIDVSAIPVGHIHIGQLNGRVLPIAASLFANEMVKALDSRF